MTSWPKSEKQTPETRPTYPVPIIAIFIWSNPLPSGFHELRKQLPEIPDRAFEPLVEGDRRLPSEKRLCLRDVGLALLGIVGRERQLRELRAGARLCDRLLGQFADGE